MLILRVALLVAFLAPHSAPAPPPDPMTTVMASTGDALAAASQEAVDGVLNQIVTYLASLPVPVVRSAPAPKPQGAAGGGSGGGHSAAWWYALSTCESGNGRGSSNLYGILSPGEGNKSPGEQLSDAIGIYQRSGDSPAVWGCSPYAYSQAPGG